MILIDTNVLVALVDERDSLHKRAQREFGRLEGPFAVTSAVLVEACFLLRSDYLRARLHAVLETFGVTHLEVSAPQWPEIFDWLRAYASHVPDLCDAILVSLAHQATLPLWTYDNEFRTIWRSPKGKALKVIPARMS
jgi:predicted nucleic acid-binding protein